MKNDKEKYHHLINNLVRISSVNSIFNYEVGRKALLSLGKGNIREWLEKFLPNTRFIIEPKIIGFNIGIQYLNGKLIKAIDKYSGDITSKINSEKNIPKTIPIKNRIEIRGILYYDKTEYKQNKDKVLKVFKKPPNEKNELYFCAFHLYHCNINQYQSLQELKKLNFEIPETQFTSFISDIDLYKEYWKEGKLFSSYPTSGIVLKINSRKLQKSLGENNVSRNWAYAIN
mgnify:CR=1 FL=1|tara:strand:- start:2681 stop:3367 length:687 start_codon:yes stop_codon:yes gene_type:complete